jgi:biopolymer transport protein ExbD
MARRYRQEAFEEDEPELNISSLIDVCFLLLIYFLVTTTLQKKETDLPMQLPAAAPSEEQPPIDPMFIKIDANGAIYVGAGPSQMLLDTDTSVRDLPLLRQQLETYSSAAASAETQPLVQIYADGEASEQRVVDVLNALAGAHINKVTFTDLIDEE